MARDFTIICIGSTSQDIFFPTSEGILIDTPEDLLSKQKIAFEVGGKYRVDDRYEAVGGVAANVAQGLARQGLRVACYSKVGKDALGEWIVSTLKQAQVSTDCLFVDPEVKSDLSAIVVLAGSGERTIFHNRDANEKLQIIEEKLLPAEWFFVSALNGDWEKNMELLLALKAKGGVRLAYNPGQHNIRHNPQVVKKAIGEADVLMLNKDEAIELILGNGNAADFNQNEGVLLGKLHELGAKTVGLTDGPRGAWASDGKRMYHSGGAEDVSIVDATGAGDAFSSAFFGALASGNDLAAALQQGSANSRSVIQHYGASAGLLDAGALRDEGKSIVFEEIGRER